MRAALIVVALLACPTVLAAQDRDGDRVLDAVDLCPDARETTPTLFAGDGCPDTDGDHDGVVDDYDACPGAAETVDGYQDLDGCPDVPREPSGVVHGPDTGLSSVGCWQGEALLDLRTSAVLPQLAPRADAPTWMGTTPLDCYARVVFDGRQILHCASPDGAREATLAFRSEAGHASGYVAFRGAHGNEVRAWRGARVPDIEPRVLFDTLAAQASGLEACYQRELERTPGLAGRVVTSVTVETSGELTGVRVIQSSLTPARPEVGACLVRELDALRVTLPPTCSPRTIRVPFVFEPEPTAPAPTPAH